MPRGNPNKAGETNSAKARNLPNTLAENMESGALGEVKVPSPSARQNTEAGAHILETREWAEPGERCPRGRDGTL